MSFFSALFQYQIKVDPLQPIGTNNNEALWHEPWSEPVRQKINPALAVALMASGLFAPLPASEDIPRLEWTNVWQDPVRSKPALLTANQQFIANPARAPNEDINKYEWTIVWDEPVRVRPGLAPSEQQFIAFQPVITQVWYPPGNWPDTAPAARRPVEFPQPAFVQVVVTAPAPVMPWTNWPDFAPAAKRTAEYQNLTFLALTPSATVVEDWIDFFKPPRLTPSDQLAFVPLTAAPTVNNGWFVGLSEPVRSKFLNTATQQFAAYTEAAPFQEAVLESKFHQPWSEPIRTRFLPTAEQPSFTIDTAAIPTSLLIPWFGGLSEPVRLAPRLVTGAQQTAAYTGAAPFPEVVTEDRWHQPWSEPVRFRQGLAAYQQVAAVWNFAVTEVVTLDKWYAAFRDPVRVSLRLLAGANQDLISLPFNETTLVSKWFEALSEPVRLKQGLLTKLQSSYTNDTTGQAIKIIATRIPWYANLSEPIRIKLGLLPGLQQAFAFDPLKPSVTIISASLNVTEQGDIFACQTFILAPPAPLIANVSIVENVAQSSTVASIEVPQIVPATGTPVTTPAGARVAIIEA